LATFTPLTDPISFKGATVNVQTHGSFKNRADILLNNTELNELLTKKIADNPETMILICGHSLGGAAAIIYSWEKFAKPELTSKGVHPHWQCITFGAPMVGNSQFCEIIDSIYKHRFANYIHRDDSMPLAPKYPGSFGDIALVSKRSLSQILPSSATVANSQTQAWRLETDSCGTFFHIKRSGGRVMVTKYTKADHVYSLYTKIKYRNATGWAAGAEDHRLANYKAAALLWLFGN